MTNLVVETNKNSKRKRILLGFLIVLFVMISSILLFLYPFASKEKVNYFTGENPILFQGKQEGNALSMENGIYIPIEFLKEQIDENIFYDEPSKAIIITTKNKVIYMPIDSLTYFVNEEPIQLKMPSLIDQNGEYYIALDLILPYYEIQYSILLKTKLISKMPGVNVVSPTWFELSGSDGSIKNLGSLDYVNWAKKRGYQIWGLFSNV